MKKRKNVKEREKERESEGTAGTYCLYYVRDVFTFAGSSSNKSIRHLFTLFSLTSFLPKEIVV